VTSSYISAVQQIERTDSYEARRAGRTHALTCWYKTPAFIIM